jgi:hypothetical protein
LKTHANVPSQHYPNMSIPSSHIFFTYVSRSVTLGQYTRALAEGYSKRSTGVGQAEEDVFPCFEVTESASKVGRLSIVSLNQKGSGEFEASLSAMDGHLAILEDHGRRWRQRYGADTRRSAGGDARSGTDDKKKRTSKSWLPVFYSSSFAPVAWDEKTKQDPPDIRLIAMWSRTRACRNCAYIPLDEEVQAGWDVVGGENEVPGAIACPRCGSMIVPMLAIEEMSMEKALAFDIVAASSSDESTSDDPVVSDFAALPPQIGPTLSTVSDTDVHYVAYRSPSSVRLSLEQHVEEHGEEVLARDRLLQLDPEVGTKSFLHCSQTTFCSKSFTPIVLVSPDFTLPDILQLLVVLRAILTTTTATGNAVGWMQTIALHCLCGMGPHGSTQRVSERSHGSGTFAL